MTHNKKKAEKEKIGRTRPVMPAATRPVCPHCRGGLEPYWDDKAEMTRWGCQNPYCPTARIAK